MIMNIMVEYVMYQSKTTIQYFVGKLGKQSYKSMFSGVFVSAVGESFYHQCLPDNSVNLGISTHAMMCLSKM